MIPRHALRNNFGKFDRKRVNTTYENTETDRVLNQKPTTWPVRVLNIKCSSLRKFLVFSKCSRFAGFFPVTRRVSPTRTLSFVQMGRLHQRFPNSVIAHVQRVVFHKKKKKRTHRNGVEPVTHRYTSQ